MKYCFRLILLLSIIAMGIEVNGQINYRTGRIITNQNDTIAGLIKDWGGARNLKYCWFKESRRGEKVTYEPGEIKSYQILGDKHFTSQEFFYKGELNQVFAEVLLEGGMNLYYHRNNKIISYYLEKDEGNLIGLLNLEMDIKPKSEYDKYGYSKALNLKVPLYKDSISYLFQDSKNIQDQLKYVDYNQESLINITRAYLNETCEGEDCIIFERDLHKTQDKFGIFSGLNLSQIFYTESNIESGSETTVPFGIFYNFPLPRINERFSFQIELIYRHLEYGQFYNVTDGSTDRKIETHMVGMPLLLNYEILASKLSPTISIGKEFGYYFNSDSQYSTIPSYSDEVIVSNTPLYHFHKGGWFFEVGLNYKINRKLSLFSNIRIQRHYNKIAEKYENRYTYKNVTGTEYMTNLASLHIGVRF